MRARATLLFAGLLAFTATATFTQAEPQGYLAMYDVKYMTHLAAGEVQGVTISFHFDQWIFDHEPGSPTSTPHVFEDLRVNVTFPEPRNDGSTVFLVGMQQPSLVLIEHDLSLGDVPPGLYHYDLEADLPAAPFYCIELALPPEYRAYLSTETTFCAPASTS